MPKRSATEAQNEDRDPALRAVAKDEAKHKGKEIDCAGEYEDPWEDEIESDGYDESTNADSGLIYFH